MKIEILADRRGYHKDIKEVRNEWIGDILNFLNIETKIFEESEDNQALLLEYLAHHKISIIDYPSIEAFQIFFEGELVGEWAGPKYSLKEDENGKLYYKIDIETWSIIEENIELN
jgi:hypothetical protein